MRTPGEVLGELRAMHSLQADAQSQLVSVRREQLKLASHEADLLAQVAFRVDLIDELLDEYSTVMAERGKALA